MVSLVGHIIWPVTLLVVVLVLRRQIGDFLSAIGGWVTQVSVMSVTIDDRSWSAVERARAVAQTQGDFVALLGLSRRFELHSW